MLIKCAFMLTNSPKSPVNTAFSAISTGFYVNYYNPENQALTNFMKISEICFIFAAMEKWQSGRMRRS